MTILYAVLGFLGLLVAFVLGFGFASPRVARMKRSIEIAAPPEKIWPNLNNLRNFVERWSPWSEKDPQAKHAFNEIAEGVGATFSWIGDPKKSGEGTMKITRSEPMTRVVSHLAFKGRGEADAGWTLEDLGGGRSRVTWDFEADNGMNPLARIFGRLIEKFLGPDYEQGLAKLKSISE